MTNGFGFGFTTYCINLTLLPGIVADTVYSAFGDNSLAIDPPRPVFSTGAIVTFFDGT